MRRHILPLLVVTVLFSSCAYQGVVVEKRFRPVPFSYSLGLDAMYNFQLRDSVGQTNSQMVTADVFASYRVGDYFNDMQSPPAHDEKQLEGFRLLPREMNDGPYQPVRVMQMRAPAKGATNIALGYDRVENALKIPRWQTVRVAPIRMPERIVAKIAVPAQKQFVSALKVARPQTVRIVQIQPSEKTVAKVAVDKPTEMQYAVKIPRWQTVKLTQVRAGQPAAAKAASPAPERIANVKILRWQTVRIVQIQPPQSLRAKIAQPAQHRARSAMQTPATPDRRKQSAKIGPQNDRGVKVASVHHRKTVASVN